MYKKILILLIVLLVLSTPVSASWWNESYYKTPLLLNNTGNASILTNFQVLVNVTYNSSTVDAEFTSFHLVNKTSNTEMTGRFWVDRSNSVNGSYANIWLNISSIPASAWDNTTYALYSRNAIEVDGSNGDKTFDFFDDFNNALDTNKWNPTVGTLVTSGGVLQIRDAQMIVGKIKYPIPFIMEERFKHNFGYTWFMNLIGDVNSIYYSQSSNPQGIMVLFRTDPDPDSIEFMSRRDNVETNGAGFTGYTGEWNNWKIVLTTDVKLYRDNTQVSTTLSTNVPTVDLAPSLSGHEASASGDVDWVRIRKYITTEPTVQLGTTLSSQYEKQGIIREVQMRLNQLNWTSVPGDAYGFVCAYSNRSIVGASPIYINQTGCTQP